VLPLPDAQERVPDKDVQITLKFRKAVKHIRELIREDLEKVDTQEATEERGIYHVHERSLYEYLAKEIPQGLHRQACINKQVLPFEQQVRKKPDHNI
jgi:hypothetical protein